MSGRAPTFHSPQAFDSDYHAPALVEPIVKLLGRKALVLDGTLGGGGHSAALLEAGVARVVGVDRDADALAAARARLAGAGSHFSAFQGNYAALDNIAPLAGLSFNGILLDLGISSHQIDDLSRGFSFREGAPLDMRMGSDAPRDAAALLNESDEDELTEIFRSYGDEPRAGRLAREIVHRRASRPFETSDDLVAPFAAHSGRAPDHRNLRASFRQCALP